MSVSVAHWTPDPPTPRPVRGPRSVGRGPGTSTRPVIVADEDVDSRELLALQVARHLPGRELLLSPGGQHLLDLTHDHWPDIVLLSLGVPPFASLRVLHQVRRTTPGTHIVALSNLVSRSDEHAAHLAGADRYLTKGSPTGKLVRCLQRTP